MFCNSCGRQTPDGANFCGGCGRAAILPSAVKVPTTVGNPAVQDIQTNRTGTRKSLSLILFGVCGLTVLLIVLFGPRSETVQQERDADLSEPAGDRNRTSVKSQVEKPPDPKAQKAAQKVLREKWADETQKDLWRQGMEMTFQARGTTLYVKYVLAGDAFAFQFHEKFLQDNAETLTTLGFKNVELSNGDNVWNWRLSN